MSLIVSSDFGNIPVQGCKRRRLRGCEEGRGDTGCYRTGNQRCGWGWVHRYNNHYDYISNIRDLCIDIFDERFMPQAAFQHFYIGILLLPPPNEVCEGYVFTHVCLSTGWYPSMPCRWYPTMPCRFPGPHPGVSWRGLARGVSRPTTKG